MSLGNFTAAEEKRRYAFVLTPQGIARKAAQTRSFLVRKMEEYEALREETEELQLDLDANAVEKSSQFFRNSLGGADVQFKRREAA